LSVFLFFERGATVRINEIIKSQQPELYKGFKQRQKKVASSKKSCEGLSSKDIEELMSHSAYRRSRGGSMRQVR